MRKEYSVLEEGDEGGLSKTTAAESSTLLPTTAYLSTKVKIIYGAILFLLLVGLATVIGLYMSASPPGPNPITGEILLDNYPLIDGHNDVPWQYRQQANTSVTLIDLSKNVPNWQTDIPRMRSGKVGAQFWSVYVACSYQGKDAVRATLEQIDIVKKMSRAYSADFADAFTVQDIMNNFQAKKISSLMGIEGAHQIDGSLATLRMMFNLGVRYMTLTHQCNNDVADSAHNLCADDTNCRIGTCNANGICSEEQTEGITAFGELALLEMNRLGMLIDISHVSVPAMRRAIEISQAPVIFSHSNALALCNTVRNVPSDVLVQLQQNRGIIMLSFLSDFLNCSQWSSMSQVIDHIKYIATAECPQWKPDCNDGLNFTGIGFDNIGLGSDFDGATYFPPDLNSVDHFLPLTNLMLSHFTEEQVENIVGGNMIRVMKEVEEVSKELQSKFPDESMIYPTRGCRSPR